MSVSQRMRVPFEDVFPAGAYMVGEIEPVEDYELIKAAKAAGREPGIRGARKRGRRGF